MNKKPTDAQKICNEMYERLPDKNGKEHYKCKICHITRIRIPNSGWSNLHNHVISEHEYEYKDTALDELNVKPHLKQRQLTIDTFLPKKTKNIYGWIDWMIDENRPFTFVEKEKTRQYSSLEPICYQTLMRYCKVIVDKLHITIKNSLPLKFGLIMDGWSADSEHFVAVFASYVDQNNILHEPLLGFSPINFNSDVSAGQTSEDHGDFIEFVLLKFNRTFNSILFVCCDNCPTNIKLCRDILKSR